MNEKKNTINSKRKDWLNYESEYTRILKNILEISFVFFVIIKKSKLIN